MIKRGKSSFLLMMSTGIRAILALYTIKVIALNLGLAGTGVVGQFNNLLLVLTMIAGGGISAGITKIASDPNISKEKIIDKISVAHGYGLLFFILILLLVLFFQNELTYKFLPIEDGRYFILLLAIGHYIIFHISSLTAIINSNERQDIFARANLYSGILSALFVTIGSSQFGLSGALCGIFSGVMVQWFFLYVGVKKINPSLAFLGKPKISFSDSKFFFHFSLLSFITVVCMPLTLIQIRNILLGNYSWEEVGIWQGVVRISDSYMQFCLLFLSAFYFPKLSAVSFKDRKVIALNYAKWMLPLTLTVFTVVFLLKKNIVSLVFTQNFSSVENLFLPQLIGDWFKIASYLITYIFLVSGFYKIAMFAEVIQALLFYSISNIFGINYGAVGIVYSYMGTYVVYFSILLSFYMFFQKKIES